MFIFSSLCQQCDYERAGEKMNRKVLIYIFTILLVLVMSWENQRSISVAAANSTEIPEDAIRLRILANSDSPQDQWLKREIRDKVNAEITKWVSDLDSLENAREIIVANLDQIEQIVKTELTRVGINESFSVDFGEVQFPTKIYGNIVYSAGIYEALLITIGAGEGENWWCVLFPPLCFIDFANGDAVEGDAVEGEEVGDVEVRFLVFEWFNKVKSMFS